MTKKEGKTLNDLDEAYQWNESLDPNHIFEGEMKLVQQLKEEVPAAKNESDKILVIFLIARRHDLKETVKLLQKFLNLQKEYGFTSTTPPSFKYNQDLIDLRARLPVPFIQPIGARDINGRMIRYYFMGLDDPTARGDKAIYVMMIWQSLFQMQVEPVCAWRNGITMVIDLTDFGWKNLDMSSRGRAVNKAFQGTFPFRFRAVSVVNSGTIINALLTAAKVVVPKKLMSRVTVMDAAQLKEFIPSSQLLTRYEGGESDIDMDKFMKQIDEAETKLFESGVWKQA